MSKCKHENVILESYQVGNVNAPVRLKRNKAGEIIDWEWLDPDDRTGGELSDPAFSCADCGEEL